MIRIFSIQCLLTLGILVCGNAFATDTIDTAWDFTESSMLGWSAANRRPHGWIMCFEAGNSLPVR